MAHTIHCYREIELPLMPTLSAFDPGTLHSCVKAGLSGYDGYLTRAISILSNAESPIRDLERAYELVIIDSAWGADFSAPDGPLTVFLCGALLETLPACQAVSNQGNPSDLGVLIWERKTELQALMDGRYRTVVKSLFDRIFALTMPPFDELDPPGPEADQKLNIDQESMLRAEEAALAYLTENPRPPTGFQWIQ
jgi:hypothetical protein